MYIFKEDFNVHIDIEHCNSLEEVLNLVDHLNVDDLNVGEVWREFLIAKKESQIDSPFKKVIYPDIRVFDEAPLNVIPEKEIFNLFEEVASIASSNSKKEELIRFYNVSSDYEKNSILALVNLTYSSVYTYDNKPKAFMELQTESHTATLSEAIEILKEVGENSYLLPKEKKTMISDLIIKSNYYLRELIYKVLDGNLIPKVSEKTFFECFKDSKKIRLIPYQRCEKESFLIKRARYPMMVQLKADGKFQNIIIDPLSQDKSSWGLTLNRSGQISYLTPILEELREFNKDTGYLTSMWNIPLNIMGEALIKDPDYIIKEDDTALSIKVLDRQRGNGLLNSFGQRFVTYENEESKLLPKLGKTSSNKIVAGIISQLLEWKRVSDNLIMQAWNMVPFGSWLELDTGFTMIKSYSYTHDLVKNYLEWVDSKKRKPKLILIWNEFAHDQDDLYKHYNYINQELGMEGIVAKNTDAIISHGVCTDGVIKFKDFKECDLRITGFVPGSNQFTGGIGSFRCESECGKLRCDVAGLTMELRGFERVSKDDSAKGIQLLPNHDNEAHIGKIINVKFNELSKNKDGSPSLSLPSFVEFRDDVTVAMTYDEIVKQIKKK